MARTRTFGLSTIFDRGSSMLAQLKKALGEAHVEVARAPAVLHRAMPPSQTTQKAGWSVHSSSSSARRRRGDRAPPLRVVPQRAPMALRSSGALRVDKDTYV